MSISKHFLRLEQDINRNLNCIIQSQEEAILLHERKSTVQEAKIKSMAKIIEEQSQALSRQNSMIVGYCPNSVTIKRF